MSALAIIALTVGCALLGWAAGAAWGDRSSRYLDFGVPVLLGGLIGALVGGLIGLVAGAVVFT